MRLCFKVKKSSVCSQLCYHLLLKHHFHHLLSSPDNVTPAKCVSFKNGRHCPEPGETSEKPPQYFFPRLCFSISQSPHLASQGESRHHHCHHQICLPWNQLTLPTIWERNELRNEPLACFFSPYWAGMHLMGICATRYHSGKAFVFSTYWHWCWQERITKILCNSVTFLIVHTEPIFLGFVVSMESLASNKDLCLCKQRRTGGDEAPTQKKEALTPEQS